MRSHDTELILRGIANPKFVYYLLPGRDKFYMVAAGNSFALNQDIQEAVHTTFIEYGFRRNSICILEIEHRILFNL